MNTLIKIYLVTNCYGNPNAVYIGKTKNCRKNNHKLKYGKDIEYTYIDEIFSLSYKDWVYLEIYWIEQFRQWGFEVININKKGGGGPEIQSQDAKDKIGKKHKGRDVSLETRLKISESRKGQTQNEETKRKKSLSLKGKIAGVPKTKEHILKMSKPISQYTLDNEHIKDWNSLTDVYKELGFKPGNLCNNLTQRNKTAYGFVWKYKI